MIDLEYAKRSFQEYLQKFDQQDDKIRLKCVHTFCVLDAADYICRKEKTAQDDHELALLIALLHDIGRFEQLKAFNSYDDTLFDHAKFGVKLLFEEGLIRNFVVSGKYDGIIEKAISYHSLYSLPEGLSEKERLHCRIIRDADKLDNFRVKETEKAEAIFGCSAQMVGQEAVSDNILQAVREHRCIYNEERTTHMDMWISYLAFIFDLNFVSSFLFIQEHNYVSRNIARIPYTNLETRKRMEEIESICLSYIKNRAF